MLTLLAEQSENLIAGGAAAGGAAFGGALIWWITRHTLEKILAHLEDDALHVARGNSYVSEKSCAERHSGIRQDLAEIKDAVRQGAEKRQRITEILAVVGDRLDRLLHSSREDRP